MKSLLRLKFFVQLFLLNLMVTGAQAQEVLFQDDFAGSAIDTAKWNITDAAGNLTVTGGYLEAKGKWTWGDPKIETDGKFVVLPVNRDAVEIEWVVNAVEPAFNFVGVNGSNFTGFLLTGGDAGSGTPNGIHVGIAGTGYGWKTSYADAYPVGADFKLKLRFNSNGTIQYQIDTGSGYQTLVPESNAGGGTAATLADLTTWSQADNAMHLSAQANNYNATSGNLTLKINSVTVRAVSGAGATPTPTGTPNSIDQSWYLYN